MPVNWMTIQVVELNGGVPWSLAKRVRLYRLALRPSSEPVLVMHADVSCCEMVPIVTSNNPPLSPATIRTVGTFP